MTEQSLPSHITDVINKLRSKGYTIDNISGVEYKEVDILYWSNKRNPGANRVDGPTFILKGEPQPEGTFKLGSITTPVITMRTSYWDKDANDGLGDQVPDIYGEDGNCLWTFITFEDSDLVVFCRHFNDSIAAEV